MGSHVEDVEADEAYRRMGEESSFLAGAKISTETLDKEIRRLGSVRP